MQTVTVQIIHAFTDAGRGGNAAGVVLDADALDRDSKQRIAARVGLSETAFVSASERAAFKLEFFTPTRQIAHCGHATVATFAYLAQQGRVTTRHSSKETIDGTRDIFLEGEVAYMEQLAPRYTALAEQPAGVSVAAVLRSLGIGEGALLAGHTPTVVNTSNSYMLVPLRDEQALRDLQPDDAQIERISDALDLIGFYPFTLETQGHRARRRRAHVCAALRHPRGIRDRHGGGAACLLSA